MKLHTFAGLGFALASSVVLAQTGAPPLPQVGEPKTGQTQITGADAGAKTDTLGASVGTTSSDHATDKNARTTVGITQNKDGTLGGTASSGANGVGGAVSGTVDSNNKTGSVRGHGTAANENFGKLDGNTDGALTRDELRGDAALLAKFNKMDANGDGKVDTREYALSTSVNQKLPPSGTTPGKKDNRSASDKAKDSLKNNNQPSDVLPGG